MTAATGTIPKVITFDFYGTLVQWHEGLHEVVAQMLSRKSATEVKAENVLHHFHAIGRRLRDTPPYKPYRDVLRESMRLSLEEFGLPFDSQDFDAPIARMVNLPPFAAR